jgi:VanZ family protein
MRAFVQPRVWLGLWLLGWVLCVVLSLIHPVPLGVEVPDGDKIEHFLAYGTLSAWAMNLFASRRSRLFAAVSLVALGITMEWAQGTFTTDRMMDWRDALANTLGVAAGQALAATPAHAWLQRIDRRLFG